MAIAFCVNFIGFVIEGSIFGFSVASIAGIPSQADSVHQNFYIFFSLFLAALITTMVVRLSFDARFGEEPSIKDLFPSILPAFLRVILFNIISMLLIYGAAAIALAIGFNSPGQNLMSLASLLLILGIILFYVILYVAVPAMVVEKTSFRALSKSARLTKQYRWQILALVFLVGLFTAVLRFFLTPVLAGIFSHSGSVGWPTFVAGAVISFLHGLVYAFGSVVMTLTYIRLREIKNDFPHNNVAKVF